MIFAALQIDTSSSSEINFPDAQNWTWYSNFIWAAVDKWIVKGYPDWTFQPSKEVNRSEYYKILLLAAEVNPSTPATNPYSDVSKDAWFGSYIWFVKDSNLTDTQWEDFFPSEWVSRSEVAESIYRLLKALGKI